MICPNCGVRELSPPYVDMKDLEVCSLYFGGCGYIWRVGEYEGPLWTPLPNGCDWDEHQEVQDHIDLYRTCQRPLPEEP